MFGYKNLGQSPKTYYGFTYPPGETHFEAPGYINDPEFLYCGTEEDPRDFSNYPKFETVSSFLNISVAAELDVTFRFTITKGSVIVYFGDDDFEIVTGEGVHTVTHSYAEGDYEVEFTPYGGTTWSVGGQDNDVSFSIVNTNSTSALSENLEVSAFTSKGDIDRFNPIAFGYISTIEFIQVPSSVAIIDATSFEGCTSLESIDVINNSNYSSIDGVLFNRNKTILEVYPLAHGDSYEVPEGVVTIQANAFKNCVSIATVVLCSTLTVIGDNAFNGCSALEAITSLAIEPPALAESSLTSVPATCDIFVPADSVETYQAAENWSSRSEYIQAISA